MDPSTIRLPDLCRELIASGYTPPSYTTLYNRIVSGRLPARREISGWVIARDDLPEIAAALRLPRAPAAGA